MPNFNEYFNLANPLGGYPYYYKKAAQLWDLAKNKFNSVLSNPNPHSNVEIEEINEIISIINHLLKWVMLQPKANINEINSHLGWNKEDLANIQYLRKEFYSNKFIFLRHTETRWHISKVINGPQNIGLKDEGIERIYKLANNEFLKKVSITFYSPTVRCEHTAIVLASMYPNMTLMPAWPLLERFYGDVSKNISLQNDLQLMLKNNLSDFAIYVQKKLLEFPGHETIENLNFRVAEMFKKVLFSIIEDNKSSENYFLFVGHGSWLQSLATHLQVNLRRIINSEDYATPLLFYPFNENEWNVLDLTKMKFIEYVLEENKLLYKAVSNINKNFIENGGYNVVPYVNNLDLIVIGIRMKFFAETFMKHYPRERCPAIDSTHVLIPYYMNAEKYLSKLLTNEEYLNNTLEEFKNKNAKLLKSKPWIDENHILAIIDGMPLSKIEGYYEQEKLKSLEILIAWYLGLKISIFSERWFSKTENLLILKELILNIGPHPKARGKIGGEACGIWVGLSPAEVEQKWFYYEHALAVQRGVLYAELFDLSPAKALGLSFNIPLKNMSSKFFSIYQAYLLLTGEFNAQHIIDSTPEEAREIYIRHLPKNDITYNLNDEGYTNGDLEKMILAKQLKNDDVLKDHDSLMQLILNTSKVYFSQVENLNLVLAIEQGWEDIINVYIKKDLPFGLGNYHAELMAEMFRCQKFEMAKKFSSLEINVLCVPHLAFRFGKEINLIVIAARFHKFQAKFPELFYKTYQSQRKSIVNTVNFEHNLLAVSISYGCVQNVKFLLKIGAEITHEIISLASKKDFPNILKIVCHRVVKRRSLESFDFSSVSREHHPLILAADYGLPENLKILLEYFKNVNIVDSYGNTVLHKIASKFDFKYSELLLQHGANIFQKNIKGINSAEILCSLGFSKILDYIPHSITKDDLNKLLLAVVSGGHLNLLEDMMVKFKFDINDCTSQSDCIIYTAITGGYIKLVEYLAERGANLNLFYQNGSAIFFAVTANKIPIAELLLGRGANINEQDIGTGRSLLMHAIKHRFDKMAEMLINRGININLKDNIRRTALMYAAELDRTSIGEMLLKKGAHTIVSDIFGQDVFGYTIKPQADDFAKLLIDFGCFPKRNLCERSVIINTFSESLLKTKSEYCIEYIQKYLNFTIEKMFPSTLALGLSRNSSNLLPCHVTKFNNKPLEDTYSVFSCYESDATVHYVLTKDDFELYYFERKDIFNNTCRQVSYLENNYTFCYGEYYYSMTPVGHDTPAIVDVMDYGIANAMLAVVLKKMGTDFFVNVKKMAINLFTWFREDDEILLGGAKRVNPLPDSDLQMAKSILECLMQQLEDYKNNYNVKNYKCSLQYYIERLDDLLSRMFTSEEITRLYSEIYLVLDEIDTKINDINYDWLNVFECQSTKDHLSEAQSLKSRCYLPKFSATCIKTYMDKIKNASSVSNNALSVKPAVNNSLAHTTTL